MVIFLIFFGNNLKSDLFKLGVILCLITFKKLP